MCYNVRVENKETESAIDLNGAKARLRVMVDELQAIRRQMWRAEDKTSRERLAASVMMRSVDVRRVQVEFWAAGLSVFIAFDRNGLPVRVTDSKEDLV